ncbi:MAG: 1,4-dihydroxy-2-naphthoate polyprenyltransferase [Desulfobacterales bacterium]|nr:1,4-dihydroxy-2-naphthoate polyprenyltransferase [Desulfobacterales bacterium]
MGQKIKYWIIASRPKTLTAGVSPVIVGTALASNEDNFKWWIFFSAMMCAFLLQIATNLVNDYFDAINKVDGENRLGPTRVTQTGLLSYNEVKYGFGLCFILALIIGIPLVLRGGVPIIIIGITAIITAYLYTGGPYPLSYYGLGEILAFIFFGIIAVCGTYYLHTFSVSFEVILLSFGLGFLSALMMSINNLRDIATDVSTGKKTIALMLGEKKARWFSFYLMILSALIPLIYVFYTMSHYIIIFSSLSALLFKKSWMKILNDPIDSTFNDILADSGKFLLIYSVFLSVGLIL